MVDSRLGPALLYVVSALIFSSAFNQSVLWPHELHAVLITAALLMPALSVAAGGPAFQWAWQSIGNVQAFQMTVSNSGSAEPLTLAMVAEQDVKVADASGKSIFAQPKDTGV